MILDAILVVLQLTVDYSGFEVADTGVSKCFCYGFVFFGSVFGFYLGYLS